MPHSTTFNVLCIADHERQDKKSLLYTKVFLNFATRTVWDLENVPVLAKDLFGGIFIFPLVE